MIYIFGNELNIYIGYIKESERKLLDFMDVFLQRHLDILCLVGIIFLVFWAQQVSSKVIHPISPRPPGHRRVVSYLIIWSIWILTWFLFSDVPSRCWFFQRPGNNWNNWNSPYKVHQSTIWIHLVWHHVLRFVVSMKILVFTLTSPPCLVSIPTPPPLLLISLWPFAAKLPQPVWRVVVLVLQPLQLGCNGWSRNSMERLGVGKDLQEFCSSQRSNFSSQRGP